MAKKNMTPTEIVEGRSIEAILMLGYKLRSGLAVRAVSRHIDRMTCKQAERMLRHVGPFRFGRTKAVSNARLKLIKKMLRQPIAQWIYDRSLGNYQTWTTTLDQSEVDLLVEIVFRSRKPEFAQVLVLLEVHDLPGFDHHPRQLLNEVQRKRLAPLVAKLTQ